MIFDSGTGQGRWLQGSYEGFITVIAGWLPQVVCNSSGTASPFIRLVKLASQAKTEQLSVLRDSGMQLTIAMRPPAESTAPATSCRR